MHILIADDEPMVRLGIRSMIEEIAPGQHAMTEACNGRELLTMAMQKPNLAFVDIKMPLMDGIQAITEAKSISPHTQWVLVTGFSDFDYAQQAIRLGVTDYLLKPVSVALLNEVLQKVTQRLTREKEVLNRRFHSETIAYFYQMDLFDEPQSVIHPFAAENTYCLFVFYIDCADRTDSFLYKQDWMERIEKALCSFGGVLHTAFILPSYDLCLVTQSAPAQSKQIREAVEQLFSERQHPVTLLMETSITFEQLYAEYERMSTLSILRTVDCFDTCRCIHSLERLHHLQDLLTCARCIEQISLSYLSRNELAFRQAISTLQSGIRGGLFAHVDLVSTLSYLRCATGLSLPANTLAELSTSLLQCAQKLHRQAADSGDIIKHIKTYVAAHYMQDIAISTLADELDITPNYLSKIFHQHAGCTFVSYLSQVRIAAAQQLLAQRPEITIREAAEAVGYVSPRHFAKVFAKLTGMNPSRYQVLKPE